jgi:hypothetical protein
MKRLLIVASLALLVVASLGLQPGHGQSPETKAFMRLKLTHAQSVLEGLATEDFGRIAKGGEAMILLSHESNWKAFQTLEYNEHSADFRKIAGALVKHANEKNLEAATLDYVLLTTNCVQCHKYVREQRAKK